VYKFAGTFANQVCHTKIFQKPHHAITTRLEVNRTVNLTVWGLAPKAEIAATRPYWN